MRSKKSLFGFKNMTKMLCGNHPYLLQAAAAAMWDAHEEKEINRLSCVTKRLYRELHSFFADTWQNWTPELRKAFTSVGIAHQAYILKAQFRTSEFIKELCNLSPELSDLEERGMIARNDRYECGYYVEPQIMLTWLSDELIKAGRSDKPFETWLQEKQLDGAFLTVGEKETFRKAVEGAGSFLKKGTMSLIEAFGKGVGSELAKKC